MIDRKMTFAAGLVLTALCFTVPAAAEVETGLGVRVGSLGIGVDVGAALSKSVDVRIGYAGFDLNRSVTQTNLTYEGKAKLGSPSALLDWKLTDGGFRMTTGVVVMNTKIDATGVPNGAGTYDINGTTYTVADVGNVTAQFKFGNSVAPYLGIGWGDTVTPSRRWSFLADIGVVYAGAPTIAVTATCAAANAIICAQLQSDIAAERQTLVQNLARYKWYPVVSLGLGYRF